MITLGSLFDGIAGFPLAGERVGIKAVWASEIEPFCIKVSGNHFPDMKHFGNITEINGAELEPVDIITGGSPCTRLSVAGKHDGFNIDLLCESKICENKMTIRATDKYIYLYTKDCPKCGNKMIGTNESALFFHQIRIIKEIRELEKANGRTGKFIRPRFMVWENVPGAFSSNKGEDFRAVLEETARIADETVTIPKPPKGKWSTTGCIMGNGWSIAWRILDAQYWGVPQRRRRIFLVADCGGQSAPEVLFKREGLRRHITESRETREGIACDTERGFTVASWDCRGKGSGYVAGTLKQGQDRVTDYTTICLQGSMIGRTDRNGPQGDGINQDVSFTLNTTDRHAVAYGIFSDSANSMKSSNPHSGIYEADTTRTLDQNGGNPACNQGGIAIVQEFLPFNATQITSPTNGNNPKYGDPCHPLCATDYAPHIVQKINCQPSSISGTVSSKWAKGTGGPAGDEHYNLVIDEVAHPLSAQPQMRHRLDMDNVVYSVDCRNLYENAELCGTLQSKENGGQSLNYQNPVRMGYSVRRLIPLECERLQDYPDGWTDITWKVTNKKGKVQTIRASDSPRYKANGNSVAVCCPEYALEGIKEILQEVTV